MNKIGITTHVLDISTGLPVAHLEIALLTHNRNGWQTVTSTFTNEDGRAFLSESAPTSGEYQLIFDVEPYFSARAVEAFYPSVQINFTVPKVGAAHYHVPLLLGPFGYSTYRGS